MALKITQQYATQADALYDIASNSKYFDEGGYSAALEAGRGDEYKMAVIGASEQEAPSDFSRYFYDKLQGTDKLDYLATTFYMDKNLTDTDKSGNIYNVYDNAMNYFSYKVGEQEAAEIYENMSGFDKAMTTVGVMLGEVANAVYGTLEGIIDAFTLVGGTLADALTVGQFHEQILGGTKWAISQDVTGTGAIAENLAETRHKYTRIDQDQFLKIIDEVGVGLARMLPLFTIGGLLGSAVYMTGLAGQTAAEAIQKNPDIDLYSLTAYTGLVVGVEYLTEKVSTKLFGGADFIGHAITGDPLRQTTSIFKRIGMDFISEAFEESVSEVLDGALDVWLVGGEDSHFATLEEVLYAGLIGGITGAVATGFGIATTKNLGITTEGNVITYDKKTVEALGKNNVKKLSKADSLNLRETIQQARVAMRQDAVADFYSKYAQKGLTQEQARIKYANEYKEAVEAQQTTQKIVNEATLALSKVMQWAGVKKFAKAVENANGLFEKQAALIRNYTEYTYSDKAKFALVEKYMNETTPGSKCKIIEDLTPTQLKIQDTFKSKYGIDVYYGDFSEADGQMKNHSVTLNENTVVLDMNQFNNATYEEVMNKVAKKQLVQTLQYTSGVLDKNAISSLKMMLSKQQAYDTAPDFGYLETTSVESLDDASLKLYADKQAETLAQYILFDETTVNKMYTANTSLFEKMYKWVAKTVNFFKNFGKKTDLTKLQFNQLLKTKQMYEKAIVTLSPNKTYLQKVINTYNIDSDIATRMINAYTGDGIPERFKHNGYISLSSPQRKLQLSQARYELERIKIVNDATFWSDPFNPQYYSDDFFARLSYDTNVVDGFERAVQNYFLNNFNFMIDSYTRDFVEAINWESHLKEEVLASLQKNINDGKINLDELQTKYKTLGDLIVDDTVAQLYDEITKKTLKDVQITYEAIDRSANPDYFGYAQGGNIVVFIDPNVTTINDIRYELQEMLHTIFHETQHIISKWTNMDLGTSADEMGTGLLFAEDKTVAKKLWNLTQDVSYGEALIQYNGDLSQMYKMLGEFIYDNMRGEMFAESRHDESTPLLYKDFFTQRSEKQNGIEKTTVTGYGAFKGINFTFNRDIPLISFREVTDSAQQTKALKNIKGDVTPDFKKVQQKRSLKNDVKTLLDKRDVVVDGKTYVSGVGDVTATNEAINVLYPKNKYATTVEYVDQIIDYGLAYAEIYRQLNPDIDTKEAHTFEEIKTTVDNAIAKNPSLGNKLQKLISDYSELFSNWLTDRGEHKLRRDFFNSDFSYSINDIKKIETALKLETGLKGVTAKEKQLGETEEGLSKIENVIGMTEDDFIEQADADLQGFSTTNVSETILRILPKIQESIDLPESFDYLKNLVEYSKTLNSQDKQRLAQIMKEYNWTSKKGYLKQIDTLTEDYTQNQKQIVQDEIADFNSPLDYIEYIDELKTKKPSTITKEATKQVSEKTKQSVEKKIVSRETIKKPEKLTLYHGTNADIVSFDSSKFGTGEGGTNIPGVYLTPNKTRASEYGSNVLKTEVTVNNVYNENVTPIKNGINGTEFVKKYIPSWYDSKTDSIVDTQKGYVDEKLNSTTGLYDLIQVAIDKNPKLSFQSIMEDLGYDAVKQDNDYVVLDPNQVKIEKPKIEKKPATEKETIKEISTPSETVKPDKPNTVSKQILDSFKIATTGISESQYFDTEANVYDKVGYDMIDSLAPVFTAVTDANYDEVRNDIKNDKNFYSDQALLVFDLYTLEMKGKFSQETQNKIEANNRRSLTISAQKLALQAKRVANRTPVTEALNEFNKKGYNAKITDEQLQEYDQKLKNKDAYIKELSDKIASLEQQLKESKNVLEQSQITEELKQTSEQKLILESGDNAAYADWLVQHAETLEQASKMQQDILKKAFDAAERVAETGQEIGFYVKKADGKPKAFPKIREKIATICKKLKSFRMWSMLSSPVTWVRNWIGNLGMKALDGFTNAIERQITKRIGFSEGEMKYNESRAGKEVYDHIAETNKSFIMSLIRGDFNKNKYDESGEKQANIQRELRAKEYESANTFQKLCLKAQDITDWGLSEGRLGDTPMLFNSICKNMGNLVASNSEYLLKGIQQEYDKLSKKSSLSETQQARMALLKKALDTKSPIDIFDAMSKDETKRLFMNAKQRTFQQYFRNQNAFSKWCYNIGQKNPVMAEVISWILPFPKAAANILTMAYKLSPFNFINGLFQLSQLKQMDNPNYKGPKTGFEKAEMIRTFSQATTGTFMLIAGAIAAALGWVDIDEDDYLGPSLKFGDVKIGLSNLAPSMTTFSTAAAMVWAWKNNKSGISESLNTLYDNTLLGNVDNLFRYSSLESFGQNLSISYLSQYIPAVLKWTNKAILKSPQKDKTGSYFNKLIKTLGSYVPGVSALVPNKIDPYTGRPVYSSGSDDWFLNFIATANPLDIKYTFDSELENEAEYLGAETSGFKGSFNINGTSYKLTNKELSAKYRAKYIDSEFEKIQSGKKLVRVKGDDGKFITTKYDKLTDDQKASVLKDLYDDATAATKINYWIKDLHNKYYTSNKNEYLDLYKKYGSSVKYVQGWNKSKFVK